MVPGSSIYIHKQLFLQQIDFKNCLVLILN